MKRKKNALPHAQHINKVLFSRIVFAIDVALERGEDASLGQKRVCAELLQLSSIFIWLGVSISGGGGFGRWHSKIFELFS